jgi:hypothetical protein
VIQGGLETHPYYHGPMSRKVADDILHKYRSVNYADDNVTHTYRKIVGKCFNGLRMIPIHFEVTELNVTV